MSSIFVIVFPQPQFNVQGTLLQNAVPEDSSATPVQQGQADPHFVGRFNNPPFWRAAGLGWDTSASEGFGPDEANPHFIGKFQAESLNYRLTAALNSWDTSASAAPVQQGQADPHFIGRFHPAAFGRVQYPGATDGQPPAIIDAQPHFIGKFQPAVLNVRAALALNSWDTSATEAFGPIEANPHHVGRFNAGSLARPWLSWDTSPTEAFGPVEANPHFVAKFQPAQYAYRLTVQLNSWDASESSAPTQLGQADPHFIGRFQPSVLGRVTYPPAADPTTEIPQENNPHFIGRFFPVQFPVSVVLALNTWDVSTSAPPPPPPPVVVPVVGGGDDDERPDAWQKYLKWRHQEWEKRQRQRAEPKPAPATAPEQPQPKQARKRREAPPTAEQLLARNLEAIRAQAELDALGAPLREAARALEALEDDDDAIIALLMW